ncbi:hypothetical protein [Rhodoblastus sp.]|uniref:hypothetical protein n=1 Tax=Rhodoblastus sp. TaxID=1962975 RepID=UPI00262618BC|nr:hypothetical protein [Rhodoblastus sp.]
MTDFCEFQFRLWRAWLEFIEVYFATVATISARLPIIAQTATGLGDHDARREARTMVTEKWRAAAAGAEAGALETAKAALKVMTGQTHPVAVAGHMMDVADAATRPARRKVRANARRLTRPRPAQRRGRDAES